MAFRTKVAQIQWLNTASSFVTGARCGKETMGLYGTAKGVPCWTSAAGFSLQPMSPYERAGGVAQSLKSSHQEVALVTAAPSALCCVSGRGTKAERLESSKNSYHNKVWARSRHVFSFHSYTFDLRITYRLEHNDMPTEVKVLNVW